MDVWRSGGECRWVGVMWGVRKRVYTGVWNRCGGRVR